jgi:hypothetical protein
MALLEYFAFEEKRDDALNNYRLLACSSFRAYIYNSVGYAQETKVLENWFQAEYIFSKFPNYLLSKVKSLNLTHEQKNKILEAVRPKEISFKSENQEVIDSIKKITQNLKIKGLRIN